MIEFHMADVIPLLPVKQPPGGKSSYNIPCPCCDENNTLHGHLNINMAKDVFRCPRCNFSGGMMDLYSYYAKISRDEARNSIISKLRICENNQNGKPTQSEQNTAVVEEYPLADIDVRSAAYNALLDKLSLASDHRKNLIERGLSEQAVSEKGYKTTPVVGWQTLAKQLQNDGLYLSGVPGFYRDGGGQWTFTETRRGIIIPVRDMHGRIQGLQVRHDNTERRKFRWISSGGRSDGCKAVGWTHFAGTAGDDVLLIEGPIKADIVNHLTGLTALSVPGVNSLNQLHPVLTELKTAGIKRIMTCFDMDMLKNYHVQNGYRALLKVLDGFGLKFGTYLWNPYYNGLDDYVYKYCLQTKL